MVDFKQFEGKNHRIDISNIIKGKIQHDKTFAAAAAIATAISFKKI